MRDFFNNDCGERQTQGLGIDGLVMVGMGRISQSSQ